MGNSIAGNFATAALVLILTEGAHAQSVPEGIHRKVQGSSTICGIIGENARDFVEKIKASPDLIEQDPDGPRFQLFSATNPESMIQWAITRPGEEAHPAATCRHIYKDATGGYSQTRNMVCDASREACDRLLIEFQELDEQMRQYIQRHHQNQ